MGTIIIAFVLTFSLICIFFAIFMLVMIANVNKKLWCTKVYAFVHEKECYKAYKNILKSNDYKYCTNDEYVRAKLNYEFGEQRYNASFEYSPITYYLITDIRGVMQGDNWVLSSFWNKFIENIWEIKSH